MLYRVNFDKRFNVRQPSFVRSRMPLRSPIESAKVNLEDHQISFEMHRLDARMAHMTEKVEEYYQEIETMLADVIEDLRSMSFRLTAIEENS